MAINVFLAILMFSLGILNMKYGILKIELNYMIPVGIFMFYSLIKVLYFSSIYHIKLEWILVKLLAFLGIFTFFASISR